VAAAQSAGSLVARAGSAPPLPSSRASVTRKSNKTLVQNAVRFVCLAGQANAVARSEVLDQLDLAPADHFVLLLSRSKARNFRAVYVLDPSLARAYLLHGDGPPLVEAAQVAHFFKYDSSLKQFSELPVKSFSHSTDAMSLAAASQPQAQPQAQAQQQHSSRVATRPA
jgi:hypothetical protein